MSTVTHAVVERLDALVPNVSDETNETERSRDNGVSNVPNETNETDHHATYRAIARLLGTSVSTAWRDCNKGRPITATRERRSERITGVYVGRFVHQWSIRRIAAEVGCSRSAVARDLRHIETLRAHGVDVDAIAARARPKE